uniref:G-patch domain-containing protein n=1 Tax=Timema monikensis TaxID=170555 RepID=A0A7R9E7Z6_9NEOP|nr:unnamed protein product [Timema monikensis]
MWHISCFQLVTTYITTISYLNSLLPPTCPIPNSAPFGKTIEQQKQTLEQQQAAIAVVAASSASLEPTGHMLAASQPPQQPALPQAPPPHQNNDLIPPGIPPHVAHHNSPGLPPPPDINFSQPPPGYIPVTPSYPPELPDLSKPPPGFPAPPQIIPEVVSDELMPSVPYFELPAGLMVPLIKLEDSEYRSLDPDSIRLPPPAPPSERLLAAVEAFYAPPCHDRPRDRRILDSEGWEKLGLYEYYRAKNAARRKKEEDIDTGISLQVTFAHSEDKIKNKSRSRSRSNSKPRSKSKSRSRSRTPPPRHYANRTNNNNNNNTNRRSPVRRPSRPYRPRSRSRSQSKSPSRSRSKSPTGFRQRSPERSPTPPSFLGSTYSKTEAQRQLDESNKGHQILCKMGWSGAGLGAKEQGIEQPISGGEVRDRTDMYKGVGINLNDPYENFRKSKGQAFINRMKARAEERL